MKLELYHIVPELQPFIKVISSVENSNGSPCTFRALPDTCVEIFFAYNSHPIATIKTKTAFDSPGSFVSSRMSTYMDVQLPPHSGSIAVCFHPGAAFRFFPLPMKELTDNNVLLSDLWGSKTSELEDTLSHCHSQQERVSVVQRLLLTFIQREPVNKGAYEHCLWQINLYRGQMPLKTLAKETNISQRQLGRLFHTFLGLAPKEYSRIKRFLCTIDNIRKYPSYSLTQIAYESGYFDQAHFIHECKEFTGMTPRELVGTTSAVY
jgi:AraC-like DNA-binding protein